MYGLFRLSSGRGRLSSKKLAAQRQRCFASDQKGGGTLAAASAKCSELGEKPTASLTQLCLWTGACILAGRATWQMSVATAPAAGFPYHVVCRVAVLSGLFSAALGL